LEAPLLESTVMRPMSWVIWISSHVQIIVGAIKCLRVSLVVILFQLVK
jgi:hypothetical protein